MPYTVNGIGTSYWGKSNREVHRHNCQHCQTYGDLESYDTTRYFVLIFLPLIPLGKLRVLDQCPSCAKHLTIKLKEWRTLRQTTVAEAVTAYEQNPSSLEAAHQAVQACTTYQDRATFVGLAGKILTGFPNDPDMTATIGATLEFFGHLEEAEVAFRKSRVLRDDEGSREALGFVQLRLGKPDEARPMLQHLFEQGDLTRTGPLFALVEAYQAQGRHADALQTLDMLEQRFPTLESDKAFRKSRKLSQKHQKSGKKFVSAAVAPAPVVAGESLGSRLAPFIWPTLLLAIIGPLVIVGMSSATSHQVYLLNGLPQRYAVELNGEIHHLPPGRAVPIEVAQGEDHVLQVASGGPTIEPVNFRIDLPMWKSWQGDHTFVVNPDRLAVFVWSETEYAVNPDPNAESPTELRTGEAFYTYEGVDYEFVEYPEEVSLPSSSSRVLRQQLDVLSDRDPTELYSILSYETEGEVALDYLRRAVTLMPTHDYALFLFAGVAPVDEFTEVAAPRLAARPVEVEWHRAYQSAMDTEDRIQDLINEYAALLAADPDNSRLLYLAARLDLDLGSTIARLDRAIELDPSNSWAYNSLAYQKAALGQFAEALPLVVEARRLMPDNLTFQTFEAELMVANQHYEPLLEANLQQQEADPLNGELVAQEILLRVANGEPSTAEARVETFLQALTSAPDAEAWGDPEQWRAYLQAMVSRGRGDLATFGELMGKIEGPWGVFQSAFARGAMAEAAEALTESGNLTVENHLLIYLGANKAGETELAEQHLHAAIEQFGQGDQEQRAIARRLAGESPDIDFLRLGLSPASKSICLAALAVRDSKNRRAYRELARTLNYQLDFPKLELDRLLTG